MTSHEYAKKLQIAADFLFSRPEFEIINRPLLYSSYYGKKDLFVAAVKALGKGEKKYTDSELKFTTPIIDEVTFEVDINRSAVCRLVKPAEYDCEPLFTPEEEAQIGA